MCQKNGTLNQSELRLSGSNLKLRHFEKIVKLYKVSVACVNIVKAHRVGWFFHIEKL